MERFIPKPWRDFDRILTPDENAVIKGDQNEFFHYLDGLEKQGIIKIEEKNDGTVEIRDSKNGELKYFYDGRLREKRYQEYLQQEDSYIFVDEEKRQIPVSLYAILESICKIDGFNALTFTETKPGVIGVVDPLREKVIYTITFKEQEDGSTSYSIKNVSGEVKN